VTGVLSGAAGASKAQRFGEIELKLNDEVLMPMQHLLLWLAVAGCTAGTSLAKPSDTESPEVPFMDRVTAIAAWLTETPRGVGTPASDRRVWDRLAAHPDWRGIVPAAEKYLQQPVPVLEDALYLEFTQTGNRTNYERVFFRLERQFNALVLAECLDNKGRFLAAIDACLQQYLQCRAWVYPAHDRQLDAFEGNRQIVDLAASRMSFNLATADYLLGDRLEPETRRRLRASIFRRVLTPIEQQLTGQIPKEWWFTGTNNWNSVCLANATGAALTLVEDQHQRALYIAGAEYYIRNFLKGFNADGYCTEGPSYWNYGYGRFITLCKLVSEATGGKLDLFASAQARRAAMFGWDIQLAPGVSPAFADCSIGTRPSAVILDYTSRRLGDPRPYRTDRTVSPTTTLFLAMLDELPATESPSLDLPAPTLPIRTWFDATGVLVCRPTPASPCRLAAAFKGGHNGEHHNHNDLGSFVVTVDGKPLLLDPGSEIYTKFTFSHQRYDSDANNSYGHPVPVVGGQLQKTGIAAKADIVDTRFTDAADHLTLDLTQGYDAETLEQLRRQFIYSRQDAGTVTIIDTAAFTAPTAFETALVTHADIEQPDPQSLRLTDGTTAAMVRIEAEVPFTVRVDPLKANFRSGRPKRIAITLDQPVQKAAVKITITPVPK
jgi:hypothetical protein